MDDAAPLIRLTDLAFSYDGKRPVLKDLHLAFYRGDRVGLLAPNGSGKTTLFHLIMGLLTPDAGSIEIFGEKMESEADFSRTRTKIGFLFQDADDQLFSPTVIEDVAFGPLNMGKSREEAIALSKKVLDFLGIAHLEHRITFKLSGGEKKLVSLATVLSMEPQILLLDEPLTGLDMDTRAILKKVLLQLNISFMVISHDIEFLKEMTTSVYTLRNGTLVSDDQVYVHQHDHAHVLGYVPHQHEK